jgi:hypothetical protein
MVPPFRRAYNQLKMKVRALPTWRNPVGEGAKRTRGLPCVGEFNGSDIKGRVGLDSCVERLLMLRKILLQTPRGSNVDCPTFDGTDSEKHRQAKAP